MIKPYYQDEWVTIYHGDCEQLLPLLPQFDLLLTDPPYGIGEMRQNPSRSMLAISKNYGVCEWDNKPISKKLLGLIRDKAKKQIIFGGNYYELPSSSCWLVWDKETGKNDFADCELAWTNLDKAIRIFRFHWQGMLQGDMKNKETRCHPTQKPTPLMKWCILQAGENTNTIIDPFVGSGSTLFAAKQLSHKSTGIEIEERYCEIAANRCRQMVMDLRAVRG